MVRPLIIIICALAFRISHEMEIAPTEVSTPGVIVSKLGRVSFIQDTVTVKMDMSPMRDFRTTLMKAKKELDDILGRQDVNESKVIHKSTLALLKSQLERLDMMFPNRVKRSLIPFGGDILHSIFGTATDKQIDQVNRKIIAIEQWAASKGALLTKTLERVNKHSRDIHQLNVDLRELATELNKNSKDIRYLRSNALLESIGSYLSFMIENYDVLINAKVVHSYIYIFVPFASAVSFSLFHFVPFPSYIDDSTSAELDIKETFALISSDFSSIALASHSFYKRSCVAAASEYYLCPASKLHFYPASQFDCFLDLAVHSSISKTCKFRNESNKTLVVKHVTPFNYIFSRNSLKVSLSCSSKSQLKEFKGAIKVNDHCGVSAPNLLRIYPSHSRAADVNLKTIAFPSIFLRHLTIPEPARNVVVQHLSTENPLVDDSMTWSQMVADIHPYVSYIATPIIIALVVVALIVGARIFYIKKLKTLITKIKRIPSHPAPREEEVELRALADASQ